jgi:hypothetical protein
MSFEKNLNTFKTSLLKAGGATSGKEYLVQTVNLTARADAAYAADAFDALNNTLLYAGAAFRDTAFVAAAAAAAAADADDAGDAAAKAALISATIKAPYKLFFFKPYNSPLDFVERVVTIISAPISLSLLAVEQLVEFLVLGLKSIVDFARDGKFDFEKPRDAICSSFKLLLMAVVSPLLNTVDVIGSSIASGLNKPNDEVEDVPVLGLNSQ